MKFDAAGLINLISHIDLPKHDEVVELAQRSYRVPKIVRPIAGGVIAALLAGLFSDKASAAAPIGVAMCFVTAVVEFFDDQVMVAAERKRGTVSTVIGGICLFIAAAFGLASKQELWIVAAVSAGAFCAGWVFGQVGLVVVALAVQLMNKLLKVLASPIAVPVLAFAAARNRSAMRNEHKEWVTSGGSPVVHFNRDGVSEVTPASDAMFVMSPRLRTGGKAVAMGIPLFTMTELYNSALVNQRMTEAYEALGEGDAGVEAMAMGQTPNPLGLFNPATGLPMLDVGMMDVGGNVFGTDNMQVAAVPDGLDGH